MKYKETGSPKALALGSSHLIFLQKSLAQDIATI